jgi:integral membrane protein
MLKKPVHILRIMGILDGISLLILIGVAMPLKYMADLPIFVTIIGGLHGFIFTLYVLSILYTTIRVRWNIVWSIIAFAAAFVPLGNFIFDIKLKKLATEFV